MDSVLPPKEDTMASVRKAFGLSDTDTGSPEVQIALLTARITHLTEHLKVFGEVCDACGKQRNLNLG